MLRTSNELIRYDAEAADGQTGSQIDLLFDDQSWKVRFIVVDTGGFHHHHKVLVDRSLSARLLGLVPLLVLRQTRLLLRLNRYVNV